MQIALSFWRGKNAVTPKSVCKHLLGANDMMKTLLMATIAVGALAVAPAHAEDMKDVKGMVEPAPAMAPADAAASAATEATEDGMAAAVTETTLKDGTKVKIEGDMVTVEGKDGKWAAAPDGEHELADGAKVVTKDGKLVKPEAAPAGEEKHEGEGHDAH
jgi:hypothetical protein